MSDEILKIITSGDEEYALVVEPVSEQEFTLKVVLETFTVNEQAGTVNSINGIGPDVLGNVVIDADDVPETASRLYLTSAERLKLTAITGANTGDETAASIMSKIGDGTKINSTYLPSYVDDVLEVANYAALPVTGEQGKVYLTLNDNKQYRWSGSVYVAISNVLDYATQAEAEGNTENTKVMTALRVFQNFFRNATSYLFTSLTTSNKTLTGAINELNDNKVDKVTGLGLSENSFSTAEKSKLAAITGTNTGDETAASILTKIGDGTKIGAIYLPSYVDDVVEVANYAALPVTGEQGKIYLTLADNKQYRWSGSVYVAISNVLDYATQAEAEGNTENTKVMTALRVFQNFYKNSTSYIFSSLTTTNKTIVGAINELKSSAGSAGGHTILDNSGTIMPAETKLQFKGLVLSDDAAGGKTVVDASGISEAAAAAQATANSAVNAASTAQANISAHTNNTPEKKHATNQIHHLAALVKLALAANTDQGTINQAIDTFLAGTINANSINDATWMTSEYRLAMLQKQADASIQMTGTALLVNIFAPPGVDAYLTDRSGWTGEQKTITAANYNGELGGPGRIRVLPDGTVCYCISSTKGTSGQANGTATYYRNRAHDVLDSSNAQDANVIAALETEAGWDSATNVKVLTIPARLGTFHKQLGGYTYWCYAISGSNSYWWRNGTPAARSINISAASHPTLTAHLLAYDFTSSVYTEVAGDETTTVRGQYFYDLATRKEFKKVTTTQWEKTR